MIRDITTNTLRFFLLVLIQVLVLDNIMLGGFMNPYLYILLILILPFETPRWLLLLVGFALGLSIDLFSNTLGMHTFATTLLAFVRPYVLGIFAPRDGYEPDTTPTIGDYGLIWFLRYALILVFIHHLALFFVEVFHFRFFFSTLFRTIVSTLLSTGLIILSQYYIFRK